MPNLKLISLSITKIMHGPDTVCMSLVTLEIRSHTPEFNHLSEIKQIDNALTFHQNPIRSSDSIVYTRMVLVCAIFTSGYFDD